MSSEKRGELIRELAEEVRASQSATDELDGVVAKRMGVGRTDMRCLDILERDGPMTAGRLADASGLTTGAVTALLDRLEAAGYVQRTRDTDDRRRVIVEITPLAQRKALELYGPLAESVSSDWAHYTDRDLRILGDFVRHSGDLNRGRAAELRAEE